MKHDLKITLTIDEVMDVMQNKKYKGKEVKNIEWDMHSEECSIIFKQPK